MLPFQTLVCLLGPTNYYYSGALPLAFLWLSCAFLLFFFILSTIQLSGSSLRSIASVSRFMCLCMQFCCMQIFSSQCQIHRQETAMVCSVDFSEQSNCFNQISKQTVCLDSTTCHFIRDYLINILGCQ